MIPSKEELYESLAARHGEELQKKLSSATVAVCGLGGLGSNVAISLARSGVGKLILIDFDRVDISNLNRQQYRISQLGMLKTEAMRENLTEIAPYCESELHNEKMNEESCLILLKSADIVCECFDNPESKAMLVNTVAENYPDKFIVAASGMSGLHSCNSIHTRRITEKLYICGDGESDVSKDGTLFAPRVMLCAAHQATTVLRIIAEDFSEQEG